MSIWAVTLAALMMFGIFGVYSRGGLTTTVILVIDEIGRSLLRCIIAAVLFVGEDCVTSVEKVPLGTLKRNLSGSTAVKASVTRETCGALVTSIPSATFIKTSRHRFVLGERLS